MDAFWGGVLLIREIRKLLKLHWEARFVCIYRETNRCADALVNIGCCQADDLIFCESYLTFVGPLLLSNVV